MTPRGITFSPSASSEQPESSELIPNPVASDGGSGIGISDGSWLDRSGSEIGDGFSDGSWMGGSGSGICDGSWIGISDGSGIGMSDGSGIGISDGSEIGGGSKS